MINFEGNAKVNNQVKQLPLNKLEKILPTERIDKMLATVVSRAEKEMTDVGAFKAIVETISNDNAVPQIGEITLKISPLDTMNNSKERVLEAYITTISGQFALEQYLAQGTREEILTLLKNENFNEKFKRYLMDCSDKFEQKGLD